MEMEKSKVLIQFLVIFRQIGDVLSFLYARRLRGYTATVGFDSKNESCELFFQNWVTVASDKKSSVILDSWIFSNVCQYMLM